VVGWEVVAGVVILLSSLDKLLVAGIVVIDSAFAGKGDCVDLTSTSAHFFTPLLVTAITGCDVRKRRWKRKTLPRILSYPALLVIMTSI